MKILIDEPKRFYCNSDEECFFEWLNGIDGVASVVGSHAGLTIEFNRPIDRDGFYELVGLLTRYGLDCSGLRPLCASHPDNWFRDESNYWHRSVFG